MDDSTKQRSSFITAALSAWTQNNFGRSDSSSSQYTSGGFFVLVVGVSLWAIAIIDSCHGYICSRLDTKFLAEFFESQRFLAHSQTHVNHSFKTEETVMSGVSLEIIIGQPTRSS
jgi:hypothetical protein